MKVLDLMDSPLPVIPASMYCKDWEVVMSKTLVERLRKAHRSAFEINLFDEAADRIEELEARLKAGCEDMADECPARTCGLADKLQSRIDRLKAGIEGFRSYMYKNEDFHYVTVLDETLREALGGGDE